MFLYGTKKRRGVCKRTQKRLKLLNETVNVPCSKGGSDVHMLTETF